MDKLIDTTIFVDFLRGFSPAQEYLNELDQISCSQITAAELLQGCTNKKSINGVEKLLKYVRLLPLTPTIGKVTIQLIKDFSLSHHLTIPDALIAATALEDNLTLVTSNVKHFRFIPKLRLVDWTKDSTSA